MKFFIQIICILFILEIVACGDKNEQKKETIDTDKKTAASDPLPSWNDGVLKKSIIDFVTRTTKEGGSDFIPVDDRIATFDNDGTLWAERPYAQELFAFYMTKKIVEKNPALAKKQPFKAVIEHDKAYFLKAGEKGLIELVAATHTGMTEDEFETSVRDFFATVKYPGRNVPFKQIVYQPQLEVLDFLRANGFKIFISTGGTVEFVRGISEEYYGIPKDQVIGTSFQYEFIDSNRAIFRKPELGSFNDKASKPVNIQLHIGQRPVFACGNEGGAGDIAMLKYCQSSHYPSFQMIVNHNDSIREFYYQEKDNASLNEAGKNNWHIVSMKDDWKEIYAK